MQQQRQLDGLSRLRGLQSLVLKRETDVISTLKIENDLRYRQGLKAAAVKMLKGSFEPEVVQKMTELTDEEMEEMGRQWANENKKKEK